MIMRKNCLTLITLVFCIFVFTTQSGAAEIRWECGDGGWHQLTCWSGDINTGDDVTVSNWYSSGSINVVYNYPAPALGTLKISSDRNWTTTLQHIGLPLSADYEYIGHTGRGVFLHNSIGPNVINYSLVLGYEGTGIGTYELGGLGQLTAKTELVGRSGTGTFNQGGGTNTVSDYLYLGRYSGSNGTYNLSGTGSLTARNEFVGYEGTGTFTQSNTI
jgi:T5SS/PEP-CTERM-associated repeat protein